MSETRQAILVVGSAALDSVGTPAGATEEEVGGSALYFAAAASLFAPVRVVAVVGEDFPWDRIAFLRERGVDTSGIAVAPGRTFRWRGVYGRDLESRETLATELNVFAGFRPAIPPAFADAGVAFLGNIDPDLQRSVRAQLTACRLVALDTMNYWIAGKRESLLAALAEAHVAVVNEAEALELTGEANVPRAARALATFGPKRLVVKRGPHGALFWDGSSFFQCPALPLESVVDPTGAGDTFAGGFLGYLATRAEFGREDFRQAVVHGTVLASFAVESFGLAGLARASLGEVERRRALLLATMSVSGT